jgi:RNA recognition motif-containing protein
MLEQEKHLSTPTLIAENINSKIKSYEQQLHNQQKIKDSSSNSSRMEKKELNELNNVGDGSATLNKDVVTESSVTTGTNSSLSSSRSQHPSHDTQSINNDQKCSIANKNEKNMEGINLFSTSDISSSGGCIEVDCAASNSNSTSLSQISIKLNKKKLFVQNIEWKVHENMLNKLFNKFGKVKKCKIIRNNQKMPKGFGTVEYYSEVDAANALAAKPDELFLNGRQMSITYYREKAKINNKKKKIKIATDDDAKQEKQEPIGFSTEKSTSVCDLPYNVLVNIFSRLCLRDLCIIEQGKQINLKK